MANGSQKDTDLGANGDQATLRELLAFYGELGVDAVLADPAVDWLAIGATAPGDAVRQAVRAGSGFVAPSPAGSLPPATRPRPGSAAASAAGVAARAHGQPTQSARSPSGRAGDQALPVRQPGRAAAKPRSDPTVTGAAEARKRAAGVTSLETLREALEAFEGCALKHTAKNLCLYRGAERARLMLIGEAPGRDEDLEGRPFVGPAGQLLDKMLASIGLGEGDVHITNVVYWRPPGNRTPTAQETGACRPFLEKQVELVGPELIVLLGGAAAKNIFDTSDGIMKSRGKWRKITLGGRHCDALATLHPAYLLRTPAAKRLAWRDLLALQAKLK